MVRRQTWQAQRFKIFELARHFRIESGRTIRIRISKLRRSLDFTESQDPTNSITALKDDGQLTRPRANPIRLSSLKGKMQPNKFTMHREHHEDRRYRVAWMIELNQARSKPDTVDRSVRTASTLVHNYNSTQYCKTETVFSIFPFLQTNITSQMWPS